MQPGKQWRLDWEGGDCQSDKRRISLTDLKLTKTNYMEYPRMVLKEMLGKPDITDTDKGDMQNRFQHLLRETRTQVLTIKTWTQDKTEKLKEAEMEMTRFLKQTGCFSEPDVITANLSLAMKWRFETATSPFLL